MARQITGTRRAGGQGRPWRLHHFPARIPKKTWDFRAVSTTATLKPTQALFLAPATRSEPRDRWAQDGPQRARTLRTA